MNRAEAKKIAEDVTLENLRQMFINAKDKITDWEQPCRVNKRISLGAAFNILSAGLNSGVTVKEFSMLGIINMIWAFGEYLPDYQKPFKKVLLEIEVHHQEPDFSQFNTTTNDTNNI